MTVHRIPARARSLSLSVLLVAWLSIGPATGLAAPHATATPSPAPTARASTAQQGDRIAITFVSDRSENGPSSWFDSSNRPRRQETTVLPVPVTGARLWTSTLVFTAQRTAQRLSAGFTTSGSFARCVVTVNDEVRDEQLSTERGGRVSCAP